MIRRRHVIYVEGYDPQGAEGYYRLFERSWRRFLKIWPLTARLGSLELDSEDFAHWDVSAAGPNWQVATRYDFLRQEHFIRANMAEPLWRQVPRALGWAFDYLAGGTLVRVMLARWEFALVLLHFQLLLCMWIVLALAGGWLAAATTLDGLALPVPIAIVAGMIAGVVILLGLRPLADRWFVIQINNHWPHLVAFARGNASCFDAAIEACARRIVAAARANEVDEIVVVGHSGGGALAPAAVVRALALDADVGRCGPQLVLLVLGSIAPGAALHPKAAALRAVFARLAVEPSVVWIDTQARKDVMNFYDFDPVEGIGVEVGAGRCNPLIWTLRLHDMLSPEFYWRIQWNFFRRHYQFIMANDQRAPYDYFMLIGGPVPVAGWARDAHGVLAAFDGDGRLAHDRVCAPAR